ncbi:hypothetical protein [Stutzerimonas azotifigens]|uniref:hypothetical protein n=1 Tax=Stutzerimonas azotifigens TaxID=291995 RepID=UPI000411E694|nr:hypothetical protein [Stutzerimonas azotifigens]
MTARARFTHMQDGTADDWAIIARDFGGYARQLPDRILAHLQLLDGDFGGFPVDRLTHSLQTATRAHRDGRDEEYVVCALLHDIGDTLGSVAVSSRAALPRQMAPGQARDAGNGDPLPSPATPHGAICRATLRDGPAFARCGVTRRLFGMTKLRSSCLASRKNRLRRGRKRNGNRP